MSTEDHADAPAPADPDTPADADLDEHNAAAVGEALDGADARLVAAIAEAMLEAGEVTKSSTNVDQGYKFASAEAILAAVRRPLLERGVILTPQPRSYETEPITSRNGAKGEKITVAIDFTFRGHGATLAVTDWRGIGQDYGDKALGKAYTNAVKTFVRVEWLLPTEHDDPEASPSGERVDTAAPAAAEPPAWAQPARVEPATAALAPYIGEEATVELLAAVAAYAGCVPNVVSRALIGFARRLDDVVARAGLAPTDAPTDAPKEEEAPPAEEAPADLPPEPAPPGTVDPGDLPADPAKQTGALRAAGCICPNPLGPTKDLNDGCPIKGHGIPF